MCQFECEWRTVGVPLAAHVTIGYNERNQANCGPLELRTPTGHVEYVSSP